MTLFNATPRSGPYAGNGSLTTFDYTFPVLDIGHLAVIVTDASGIETAPAFTATGIGNPSGGTVTLSAAPASSETVAILRDMPVEQENRLPQSIRVPAPDHRRRAGPADHGAAGAGGTDRPGGKGADRIER